MMNKRKRCDGDPENEECTETTDGKGSPATPTREANPVQLSQLKFSFPLSGFTDLPRKQCRNCDKKRKYYCYNCILPIHPEHHRCDLALPLQLYIYKHFNEKNSRSTAIHAKVVSPDVHVFEYPDLGPELDPAVTLVLYPSPEAQPLSQVDNLKQYKNVVVIEATWQQSRCISREPQVLKYKRVRLDHHSSIFWRYQSKDETYLATIEAIYFFFMEYHNAILAAEGSSQSYNGEYDDLLFFYSHIYQTIQHAYKADRTLEYTPRGKPNYIHYDDEDPVLANASERTAVRVGSAAVSSNSEPKDTTEKTGDPEEHSTSDTPPASDPNLPMLGDLFQEHKEDA